MVLTELYILPTQREKNSVISMTVSEETEGL